MSVKWRVTRRVILDKLPSDSHMPHLHDRDNNEVYSSWSIWVLCEMIFVKHLVHAVSGNSQYSVLALSTIHGYFHCSQNTVSLTPLLEMLIWWLRHVDFVFKEVLYCIKPNSGLWFSIQEPLFPFSRALSCHLNPEMKMCFTYK